MRYSLRALLIIVSTAPPLAALAWLKPAYFVILVAFALYVMVTLLALGVIQIPFLRSADDES